MYVYLLWDHGEYGPGNTRATLDRSMVDDLASEYLGPEDNEPLNVLRELLQRTDEQLLNESTQAEGEKGVFNLTGGWGSLHFQIVRLSE